MQMKISAKLTVERSNVCGYVRRSEQQRNKANNDPQARLLRRLEISFKCSAVPVGVGKGEERQMEKPRRGRGKGKDERKVHLRFSFSVWEMLGCRLLLRLSTLTAPVVPCI